MADVWRATCGSCTWVAFADEREHIDRMAREHVADSSRTSHVVKIEQAPRR